jgi:hypothetical protein
MREKNDPLMIPDENQTKMIMNDELRWNPISGNFVAVQVGMEMRSGHAMKCVEMGR